MRRIEASSGDPWPPLVYTVRRRWAMRGKIGLRESGWTVSSSKYAGQSAREPWREQVGEVYGRERDGRFLGCDFRGLKSLF